MILWLEQSRGFNIFFRPCKEVTRLSSESLERRLSLSERLSMRVHFLYCKWCSWYLEQLRLVRTQARDETPEKHLPAGSLGEEARQRILKAVKQTEDPSK